MSTNETLMDIGGGFEVALGLNLPDKDEQALMAQSPEYPQERMLDLADIKKALADDFYLQERKRFAKFMINQNPLGKCNASALKGALEQIRENQGMKHVILSDNDAYMQMNGGRDSGSALIRAFQVAQKRGVAPLEFDVNGSSYSIPLNAYADRHMPSAARAAADNEAKRFRGWEWYRAPRAYSEFARCVASELARRNPIVFAWHVGNNSMRLRNGYVVTGRGRGNHATMFQSAKYVGGQDIVHPDCKNSWGPSLNPKYGRQGQSWGDRGYALFTMEQAFACNQWHDTYIVTSARPDYEDQFIKSLSK
jgi:hypothetical protein